MPTTKKTKDNRFPQIPTWEAFDSEELKKVWELWLQFRKEMKWKGYAPTGLIMTITELRNMAGHDDKKMIAIIKQSMSGKGWQGFWPLKEIVDIKGEVGKLTESMTRPQPPQAPQKAVQAQMDLTNWKDIWEERKIDALTVPIDRMILGGGLVEWVWSNEQNLDTSPEMWSKYMITAKAIHERHLAEDNTPQNRELHRKMQKEGWEKDIWLLQAVEKRAKIVAIKRLLWVYKEQNNF